MKMQLLKNANGQWFWRILGTGDLFDYTIRVAEPCWAELPKWMKQ